MVKKLAVVVIAGMFVFFAAKALLAAEDAGNKICPISGEKIDDKTKVTYEYQGKIYNFCCAGCPDEFKKDPEKYIKKVEEELQGKSKEQSGQPENTTQAAPGSEAMPEGMREHHQY